MLFCKVKTKYPGASLGSFFNLNFMFLSVFAELENRLLARFDSASQKRELAKMAECAKILAQVIRLWSS